MSITGKFAKRNLRPNIQIPYSNAEFTIEAIALFGLLLGIWGLWSKWSSLPNTIPQHFNIRGKPDAWGNKTMLLTLPPIMVLLYLLLTIGIRFPKWYRYPWKITEENAEIQYRLARLLIIWLKAVVECNFSFIIWGTIQVARGKAEGLGTAFLPIVLALVFIPIAVYFVKAYKAR